jgi:hypothetical protein
MTPTSLTLMLQNPLATNLRQVYMFPEVRLNLKFSFFAINLIRKSKTCYKISIEANYL